MRPDQSHASCMCVCSLCRRRRFSRRGSFGTDWGASRESRLLAITSMHQTLTLLTWLSNCLGVSRKCGLNAAIKTVAGFVLFLFWRQTTLCFQICPVIWSDNESRKQSNFMFKASILALYPPSAKLFCSRGKSKKTCCWQLWQKILARIQKYLSWFRKFSHMWWRESKRRNGGKTRSHYHP